MKNFIENLPFDQQIRAQSALSALEDVDLMIDAFLKRNDELKSEILLDAYGLMQALFVGIDAIYQLSLVTTKFKYHVNINQNHVLRKLKYIRNDIVGHPTLRTYHDGSYGFSLLLDDKVTRDTIAYQTYIIKDKEIHKEETTVYFDEMIESYQKEKKFFMKDLSQFIRKIPNKDKTTGLLVKLFNKVSNNNYDLLLISQIEQQFLNEQNLDIQTKNRFSTRIKALAKVFTIKNNYPDVIKTACLYQILGLYKMNTQLNNKKIKLPNITYPMFLIELKHEILKIQQYTTYVSELNDKDHPLFELHINLLIQAINQEKYSIFFEWFKSIEDDDIVFIIGKMLKDFILKV